jgi:hypothetical protein
MEAETEREQIAREVAELMAVTLPFVTGLSMLHAECIAAGLSEHAADAIVIEFTRKALHG